MQNQPDMDQLMKLAQSPAGQQLLAMLQRNGADTLQNAIAMAAAGDYQEAKQTLSTLLSSPQAQALLKQMEEGK